MAQAQTALPVELLQTLNSSRLKAGDPVRMRTMQDVVLPQGGVVRKATVLEGHVVSGSAFHANPVPYAEQRPATLSIRFDDLQMASGKLPVQASLRALASAMDVAEASRRQYHDEYDQRGEVLLIGGEQISSWDEKIRAEDGRVVGYERKDGNHARLIGSALAQKQGCVATQSEEAIGVFSADACGLYGLDQMMLRSAGSAQGEITLQNSYGDVYLPRGSAALLMVGAK